MIDWLRRSPRELPGLTLGGRRVPVVIRRLARARRMTLRMARDGSEIRVSLPQWGREADALAFAESRREWLEAQLERAPGSGPLLPGMTLLLRGESLVLTHSPSARRTPQVQEDALVVGGPIEGLEARLGRWLRTQARAQFAEDLAYYAPRAGVPVPPLALTNAQARWGSCSAKGVVRLQWRLILAPDAVRRQVVAHEVAHLVHFDHSPRFHALLGELFEGDVAAANGWLRQHGRSLHAYFG